MGRFVKGDIVVINFPFSDLSGSKRRPALVISDLEGDDIILYQFSMTIHKSTVAREEVYILRRCFFCLAGNTVDSEWLS